MNRTIMERVRCMLAHVKLLKIYWAEALMTVVYIINRSPSIPLEGDIPQRVWSGKEVSYRHLRVFGCLAYVHIAKDQRGKLNPKSWSCLFLGYGEDDFGYRLWDLIDKKVIRSRDIVFMEEKMIANWEMENRPPVVDSTEVRYKLVGRVDSRQNQKPTEEQEQFVERR